MTERRPPGYLREDLEMRQIAGPISYAARTDKPVEYIALASQQDVVIGYIYANDEDKAAGWQPRPAAGFELHNYAASWMRKLQNAKDRGLKPSQALDELICAGTDYPARPLSHIVPGSRTTASGLAALKELAGDVSPPSEPARERRGR